MAPTVTSPKQPIAVRLEHIAPRSMSLRVKQHSLSWSGGDFTISEWSNDENGSSGNPKTLFTVNGKIASLTQRHQFLDKTGLPLFDITRNLAGVTWFVKLPGGSLSCEPIVTIAPRWSYFKDKFDVYVANAAMDGKEVVIEARGQDIWKLRTNFYVNGTLVMTSKRTDKLTTYIPGKRPEWRMDVAEGMDLALASVLCVYLAEILFNNSMPSSHHSVNGTQGSSSEPFKSESKTAIP
ncbi:hypothetical protein N7457_004314 [Penicillium paradoxum]|uniref:uncharacterized protein n=1 Tax=Penicillium paradoxum TaxID=176176 RepID=UPI0025496FC9|nr:uncharacterized protein N7457_004314 [Penicillium paradoxum]KAJ5782540.1 hypothetical protein N7457_004314 [Penicillium paradoxum]